MGFSLSVLLETALHSSGTFGVEKHLLLPAHPCWRSCWKPHALRPREAGLNVTSSCEKMEPLPSRHLDRSEFAPEPEKRLSRTLRGSCLRRGPRQQAVGKAMTIEDDLVVLDTGLPRGASGAQRLCPAVLTVRSKAVGAQCPSCTRKPLVSSRWHVDSINSCVNGAAPMPPSRILLAKPLSHGAGRPAHGGCAPWRYSPQGLSRRGESIRAALTTPWSNAQVEGRVTRLKFLKRQMYGRASFDLLRRRVLLAA